MPESILHASCVDYLAGLLAAWAERRRRSVGIARNLGIRWVDSEPCSGFEPDLALLEPRPGDFESLDSLRLWLPGYEPPRLTIEIVSAGHPYKDYVDTPARAAACGVGELWVYDPKLVGPRARGGPFLLQVWRRTGAGRFVRQHAGSGPAYSETVAGWLHPTASKVASQARLRISDARSGAPYWLTLNEAERERARQARQRAERERERATQAEARLREVERELALLRGG